MPIFTTLRPFLVADADEHALRFIQTVLRAESQAVVAVADGREAWRVLKELHLFSAAILALDLPGFGGLDLLKRIKSDQYLRRIPVCMTVPGDSGHGVRAECFAAGAGACLPKPFTKGQLLAVARLASGKK